MERNRGGSNFFTTLFERTIKNDSGRSKIMETVKFRGAIKFDIGLSRYKNDLTHIGSGSYADVFRSHGYILKLIRLLPEEIITRIQSSSISRTTSYIDAFNEYQISYALSRLQLKSFNNKNKIYFCKIFPEIICSYLINDDISNYLKVSRSSTKFNCYMDLFENYFLSVPRENLVIIMEDCGELMSDIVDNLHPYALLSILKQIIIGLMIAEIALEFEHRDLHSGNVLLKTCKENLIQFKFEDKIISIPSYGYQVKIIDTTFSRLKYKNVVYYKDMTSLFENFNHSKKKNELISNNKKMRMQDVIYNQMAEIINNNWHKFYPKTNAVWIKYVIYKLLKSLSNQQKIEEKYTSRVIHVMEQYNRLLDKCTNLYEFFRSVCSQPGLNDFVEINIKH